MATFRTVKNVRTGEETSVPLSPQEIEANDARSLAHRDTRTKAEKLDTRLQGNDYFNALVELLADTRGETVAQTKAALIGKLR